MSGKELHQARTSGNLEGTKGSECWMLVLPDQRYSTELRKQDRQRIDKPEFGDGGLVLRHLAAGLASI